MKLNYKSLAFAICIATLALSSQVVHAQNKDSSNLKKGKIAGLSLGSSYNEVEALMPTLGAEAAMGQCQKLVDVLNNVRIACVLANVSQAQIKDIPVDEYKVIFKDGILNEVALSFDLPEDFKKPQKELLSFMRSGMSLNEYRLKRETYSSFKKGIYYGGFSTYQPPAGGAQVVISYSLK